MTLITGIRCSDGIVMGADGAATLGAMGNRTAIEHVKKLEIISDRLIIGVSGPIGLGQRFKGEVAQTWKCGELSGKCEHEVMDIMRRRLWKHAEIEWQVATTTQKGIGNIAHQSVISSTLLALPISKTPTLMQFDQQCAPEVATDGVSFMAIGSGQPIADTFWAFLRRVFWEGTVPTLVEGVFATYWILQHAILINPGGIAEPKQIMTFKMEKDTPKIVELSPEELQEHSEMCGSAEKYLSGFIEWRNTNKTKKEETKIPKPS